jgi:hypothetical protein
MAKASKLAPVHHGVKIRIPPSPSPVPHIQRYAARPNVNQALNEKHCIVISKTAFQKIGNLVNYSY